MASIIDEDMELFYDDMGFDGYRNSYISIGSVPQWDDGQDRVHEGDDGNYYIDIGGGPTYMTFQEKNGYVSRIYYL